LLEEKSQAVKKDIKESNITLISSVKGIAYDGVNVKSGSISSEQERAIDIAFSNLEKQEKNINNEILQTKIYKRELELNNCDMSIVVGQLHSESRTILEDMYKYNKYSTELSFKLNLDESTVRRKRAKIVKDISMWLRWKEI
jgi:hypothetical protein